MKSSICGIWHTCFNFFYFPYNYKNRVLACFQTRPKKRPWHLAGQYLGESYGAGQEDVCSYRCGHTPQAYIMVGCVASCTLFLFTVRWVTWRGGGVKALLWGGGEALWGQRFVATANQKHDTTRSLWSGHSILQVAKECHVCPFAWHVFGWLV